MHNRHQYEKRMARVLDYINNNLDTAFHLDELSSIASFSKYHFHRQFKAYTGLTVFRYIARRRLKRAAFQLLMRQEISITDIAFDAGFETVEAFSKAFRRDVGVSPSHFRKDNDRLLTLDQIALHRQESSAPMVVEIKTFEEMRLAVLEHKGSPKTILHTVGKFIEWRKTNALPPSQSRTFNLMYDDPEAVDASLYRMDIGAELKGSLRSGEHDVVEKIIPACRCAYARHIGPWETLEDSVRALYSDWLPESGEAPLDFPLIIERVTLYPEATGDNLITDIYLPLQ